MKEIADMSDEELREHLDDLRLSRRKGYEVKPRVRKQSASTPDCLKGVNENLAALVLAELAKKGK
jgi:hypothetical protein